MAVVPVNFVLGFIDTDLPDVTAALRYKFGLPNATDQQLIDRLRTEFATQVQNLVKEAKIGQSQAAIATVIAAPAIVITFP